MDCKAWENEISRREADLLDAGQQKALDAHLTGCNACRDVSDRVRQGIRAMSAMPITPAPKNFLDDSWRRIEKAAPPTLSPLERLKRWFQSMSSPPIWLPLGAAAAVVLAIVVPGIRDGGGGVTPVAQYRILKQEGAVLVKQLPNGGAILETQGGKLEVEHAGRARYVLAGHGNRLQIGMGRATSIELAAGAAEVSVQANPVRPYAVEISGARVVVTGTIFKLKCGEPAEVELVEGKVRLVGPDWSQDMNPGDKLAWTSNGLLRGGASGASAAHSTTPGAASAAPASVAPVAAPASAAPAKPASPKPAGAAVPRPATGTRAAAPEPPASSLPPPASTETETGSGQQLNDPFQGR